jgi:hypothetical protein
MVVVVEEHQEVAVWTEAIVIVAVAQVLVAVVVETVMDIDAVGQEEVEEIVLITWRVSNLVGLYVNPNGKMKHFNLSKKIFILLIR